MRKTRQGEAISEVIRSSDRPLGMEEIHSLASESIEGLNLATVYRKVKSLVEAEEIVRVELPGQVARYEKAGLSHHHHFLCRSCDRLFDLPGCTPGFNKLAPRGFRVEGHDLLLFGVCRTCA